MTTTVSTPNSQTRPKAFPSVLAKLKYDLGSNGPIFAHTPLGVWVFLAITAVIYCIDLPALGWGNPYYAAAVQAGSHSLSSFWFGASDFPASITVDKPPLSLWPSSVLVHLFGLNPWTLFTPQIFMVLVSALIIYRTVRRYFPYSVALLSAFFFVTTPIVFVMFRYNNPDALMLLLIIATVSCLDKAIVATTNPTTSRHSPEFWFFFAGILSGLNFLTKQLEGLMVLPGFILVILLLIPRWKNKITGLVYSAVGLIAGCIVWVLSVQLTSPQNRPYVGGSPDNNFLQLTLAYNGFNRFTGNMGPKAGSLKEILNENDFREHDFIKFHLSDPGPLRFITNGDGTQIGWLILIALAGLILGSWWYLKKRNSTLGQRSVFSLYASWFVFLVPTFSFMGAMYHTYYCVILGPAIAVLAALAFTLLWEWRAVKGVRLGAGILFSLVAVQQFIIGIHDNNAHLPARIVTLVAGAVFLILALLSLKSISATRDAISRWLAFVIALLLPLVYIVTTIPAHQHGGLPVAGPGSQKNRHFFTPSKEFQDYTDQVAALIKVDCAHYKWGAATIGFSASTLQLESDCGVMPIGGFLGVDPSPTLDQFKDMIAHHEIPYFIIANNKNHALRFPSDIRDYVSANYPEFQLGNYAQGEYYSIYKLVP